MPRRTLTMVVEGEDKSAPALKSASDSVEELGRLANVAAGELFGLEKGTEAYTRAAGEADRASEKFYGALEKSLGPTESAAAAIGKTAAKSSAAVMPLAYLASSLNLVSRRAAIGVGRLYRMGKAVTEAGDRAGSSARNWLLAGAGLIAFLAIAGTVVRGAVRLGRAVADWTGIFDRADSSVQRVTSVTSRFGKEIQIGSAELATSGRVVVSYTGDLDQMINKMLETDRAGDAMGRLDNATSRLGSSIGAALSPAVEAFVASIIPLINQYGPDLIAWAEDAGVYLGQNLPGWIDTLVDSFDDLITVLGIMSMITFPGAQWPTQLALQGLGFQFGTRFAPGGLAMVGEGGPELMQVPRGSRLWSNPETQRMMGGYNVNIQNIQVGSVGGEPYQAGRQIGKGILAELRAKGAA